MKRKTRSRWTVRRLAKWVAILTLIFALGQTPVWLWVNLWHKLIAAFGVNGLV